MRASHKKLWEVLRTSPLFYKYLPDSQFAGYGPYTVQVMNLLTKGLCKKAHDLLEIQLVTTEDSRKTEVTNFLKQKNMYPGSRNPAQAKKKGFKFVAPKKGADMFDNHPMMHKEL